MEVTVHPRLCQNLRRFALLQGALVLLLGLGVLSAFYPAWNPWRNPWVQQAGERAGWWSYDVQK